MSENSLPFLTRLWFAWVAFFRVLFDPEFAFRAFQAQQPIPQLGPSAVEPSLSPAREQPKLEPPGVPVPVVAAGAAQVTADPAVQLLALFQREGRFIDFLEQDLAGFDDADIGAAARLVHEGCRKALRAHAQLEPIRPEEEGARVTLPDSFSPAEIKLSGDIRGSGPFHGVVRHRGWRAAKLTLPTAVGGYDPKVIAPAEVEL